MAGHRRRKTRTHIKDPNQNAISQDEIPKSFVFKYGKVTKSLSHLTREFRRVWEPNTASKLQEKKFNRLKDYKAVAGQLGITHFVYFSQNANCITQMRLFRFPRGPTLTFRLVGYALCDDIAQMNGGSIGKLSNLEFSLPPLAIFSNFSPEFGPQVELTKTFIQSMFPPFIPERAKLNHCKRVCLFHYDEARDLVCFRHYSICIKVSGITKELQKLLVEGEIPDLHDLNDISEFLASSSTAPPPEEESSSTEQEMQQILSEEQPSKNTQRKIQLLELGPRLELELTRIVQEEPNALEKEEEESSKKPKSQPKSAPLYQKTSSK